MTGRAPHGTMSRTRRRDASEREGPFEVFPNGLPGRTAAALVRGRRTFLCVWP